MNYNRNVALVLTLLLFLTSCHKVMAISNQAQSVIENIRISLNKNNSTIIEPKIEKTAKIEEFKGYIPGLELEMALNRMRSSIYDFPLEKMQVNNTHKSLIKNLNTNISSKTSKNRPYIPGEALAKKLTIVRQIINSGQISNVKAKRKIPNLMNLKKSLLIDQTENSNKIDSFIEDSQVVSFANKTKQYEELKALKKAKSLKLKLSNRKKAEIKKKTIKKTINKKLSNKEVESFTTGIKFHEFKMPKNYRIIVR